MTETLQNYLSEKLNAPSQERYTLQWLIEHFKGFIKDGDSASAYTLKMSRARLKDRQETKIENFEINLPEAYSMEKIIEYAIDFYKAQGFKFSKESENFEKDRPLLAFKPGLILLISLVDTPSFEENNELLGTVYEFRHPKLPN